MTLGVNSWRLAIRGLLCACVLGIGGDVLEAAVTPAQLKPVAVAAKPQASPAKSSEPETPPVSLFRSPAPEVMASFTLPVWGIKLAVDTRPDVVGLQHTMTAVKDFPTAVQVIVGMPGQEVPPSLPEGALVKARLSGPAYGDEAIELSVPPNTPLELKTLAVAGDYSLYDIRLEDADGRVLLMRDPAAEPVVINVIEKLLITQVTSRQLTLEEIKEKGIVIDEENFSVVNFTVGLTLGSEEIEIDMPVFIPRTEQAMAHIKQPDYARLPGVQKSFERINIPNFSLSGFQLQVPPDVQEKEGIKLPPINGIIVIPGNIGFLNQFFSVILQASNVAPEGSELTLHNASAQIVLPKGDDNIKGSGDDPLQVAKTDMGVHEVLPLKNAEGEDSIPPQGTNQAEFLVEGLAEGTHGLKFDITGDLWIPALGKSLPMTGKAAGLVQVKNPTFNIVLAHPDVVREGEAYSIFATITNTSKSPANLFQLGLATHSLSGTRMEDDEEPVKKLESLGPGQATTFEYHLISEITGEVTGTVFLADKGINGSFVLTTGVGDTGIPLSPDTLVLPKSARNLPKEPDLLFQVVRMLGQAWSVATAPAGKLPLDIERISRSYVFDRAVRVAQAGLHVQFGEQAADAAADVMMDYLGADMARLNALSEEEQTQAEAVMKDVSAFDTLRRATDAGHDLAEVLGQQLGSSLDEQTDTLALQQHLAERYASRPAHLSFGAGGEGTPVSLQITANDDQVLGRLKTENAVKRDIPFGARLPLREVEEAGAEILLLAAPDVSGYRFEWYAPAAGKVRLGLVLPDRDGMRMLRYPALEVKAGGYGRFEWKPDLVSLAFAVDTDGDGTVDRELEPESAVAVEDRPPTLVGVKQWAKGARPAAAPSFEHGDPLGRMIGVLFSELVDPESAADPEHYRVADNQVEQVSLQPDNRLAFLLLDRPVGPFVERDLQVAAIADIKGNALDLAHAAIEPDPDRGPGGRFHGQVVAADGRPIPFAMVKYIQPMEVAALFGGGCLGSVDIQDRVVTTLDTDNEGRFAVDYILQADIPPDCPSTPDVWLNANKPPHTPNFKLAATDPETGELGKASTRIHFDGQEMNLKVVIRGHASLQGHLLDEQGEPVTGGAPGSGKSLQVYARNISTGESYLSWVDEKGFYAFPREYEDANGRQYKAPRLAVGNLILRVVRPKDAFSAVTTVNLPGAGGRMEQDLLLISPNRYGKVEGRVLETDGVTGAANVLVQVAGRVLSGLDLYERSYSRGVVGSMHTDAEGRFRFDEVPVGDIELRAFRQATYEQTQAKSYLETGKLAQVNLLFPGSGSTVRGLVRDALGNPVVNAQVAGGPTLTEADEKGFFEITGLPLGHFTIYAQGKDSPALGQLKVETRSSDEVQNVVVTLQPLGSIRGTVFAADGVTKVSRQKVQLWVEPDAGVREETVTGPDGSFEFESYPLGEYSVRAVRKNMGDGGMTYTALRFAGDERDADIVFRGLGSLHGRVVQDNGTPVISDVIITRKVWRIFSSSEGEKDNVFMQYVRTVQENMDERTAKQIEGALRGAGLSAPPSDFFMLIDQSSLLKSDAKGPKGEVLGEFRLDKVLAGPYRVAAFGPFLAPAEVRGEIPRTRVAKDRRRELGDVVLTPATGQIKGRVFLPDGKTPVGEGVTVALRSLDTSGSVGTATGGASQPVLPEYSVTTNPKGQYHFPLVLRGRSIITADTGVPRGKIRARKSEQIEITRFTDDEGNRLLNVRLYGQVRGVVPAGETLTADIRLLKASAVKVRVLAHDGKTPVPHAQVSLKTASHLDTTEEKARARLKANKRGEILLFPVIEGAFSVNASRPRSPERGRAAGKISVDDEAELIPVTVTLGAVTTGAGKVIKAKIFGSVEGVVHQADGAPLPRPAQVTVKAAGVSLLATSGADGRYSLEDVPGGNFTVEAFEPFTARRGTGAGRIQRKGERAKADVALVGLGEVGGEVLTHNGDKRLKGIDLILYPSGRFSDRLITRSDDVGMYRLPGVPVGEYRITINDEDTGLKGEATGQIEKDGERATLDVRLEPSGAIQGQIYAAGVSLDEKGQPVDAEGKSVNGAPVAADAHITLRGAKQSRNLRSDSKGRFASDAALPLGRYRIGVKSLDGKDGAHGEAEVGHAGEQVEIGLALAGVGRVEGMVLDSSGKSGVVAAQLVLKSRSRFSAGPVTRFSEADGSFHFDSVPVGAFDLSVRTTVGETELGASASAVVEAHNQSVALADDAALKLQPVGRVKGRVLLPEKSGPVKGAVVSLRDGRRISLGRKSAEDGGFLFDTVPMGSYVFYVRDSASNGIVRRSVKLENNGQLVGLGDLVLDTAAPRVTLTQPEADSIAVASDTKIIVSFSEPLNAASVNANTFQVRVAGKGLPGRYKIGQKGSKVIFEPTAPLPDLKRVEVVVKGEQLGFEGQVLAPGIRDPAGVGMVADHLFQFTTRDTTKPKLVKSSPEAGAQGVALRSVVRLTFSEPVKASSIKKVRLQRGKRSVPGKFNLPPVLGGRVLVFVPDRPLKPNANYQLLIHGPVKDAYDNAMDEKVVRLPFSTLDTMAPKIQQLKLAKGARPVAGGRVALVAKPEKADDLARIEFFVNDRLVDSVSEAPYVANIPLDPKFGEKATVVAVAVDNSGNRGIKKQLRLKILPNSPPWVTIMEPAGGQVSAGQVVPLKLQAEDDVELSQLAFTVDEGRLAGDSVTLKGTAKTGHLFNFQVPVRQAVGSSIILQAVARDSQGLTARSKPIRLQVLGKLPPSVTIITPADDSAVDPGAEIIVEVKAEDPGGITGLSLASLGVVTGTQSRAVEPAKLELVERFILKVPPGALPTESLELTARATDNMGGGGSRSLRLRINDRIPPKVKLISIRYRNRDKAEPGTKIPFRVEVEDEIALQSIEWLLNGKAAGSIELKGEKKISRHFELAIPVEILLDSDIELKAVARDEAGNAGEMLFILKAKDLRGPSVRIATKPAKGGIKAGETLNIDFTSADPFSLTKVVYHVGGLAKVKEEIKPDAGTKEKTWQRTLLLSEEAARGGSVDIHVEAWDPSGNKGEIWHHVKVLDILPPKIKQVYPKDGTENVDPAVRIRVDFSEPISRKSATSESIKIDGPGGVVEGKVTLDYWSRVAEFRLAKPLTRGVQYRVSVSEGVVDYSGNSVEPHSWQFTTDGTGPRLLALEPADGTDGVSAHAVIRARFDEKIHRQSVTGESFVLLGAEGQPVESEFAYIDKDKTVELRPKNPLVLGSTYRILLTSALTDRAGNTVVHKGKPVERLSMGFSTGAIRLVRPADGSEVIENAVLYLESVADGLEAHSLVYVVNGRKLPPVVGPKYRAAMRVPAMSMAKRMDITLIVRDEKKREIARKVAQLQIVPGLRRTPPMLGVSVGGKGGLELLLAAPLKKDLVIELNSSDEKVAAPGKKRVVLKAGEVRLVVPVLGSTEGNAVISANSELGQVVTVVAVSKPKPGVETRVASRSATVVVSYPEPPRQTLASAGVAFTVTELPVAGKVHLAKLGRHSLHLPLPGAGLTAIKVRSLDPAVVTVAAESVKVVKGLVPLVMEAKAVGQSAVELSGDGASWLLQLVVGEDLAFRSGVISAASQLSIPPSDYAASLRMPQAGKSRVVLPLLQTPAKKQIRVAVKVDDAKLLVVKPEAVIEAGSQTVRLDLEAKGAGATILRLAVGDAVTFVPVTIGMFEAGAPVVGSPVAGVAVAPSPKKVEVSVAAPSVGIKVGPKK